MNEISNFSEEFKQLCGDRKDEILAVYSVNGRKTYTYGRTLQLVMAMCAFLKNSGLKQGDTLVTVLPNSIEAFVCFMASVMSGINYAPLPCTASERECNNWIRLVSPKLIINKCDIVDYAFPISNVETPCDGNMDWLQAEDCPLPENPVSRVYLMTSGTTGTPKAMSINVNVLWSSGKRFVAFYHLNDSAVRFWNYLPMSYLGGLFNLAMIPLACGGSFVIAEPFSGKTILNFWEFVIANEITAIWFVPSIVQGLLKLMKMVGLKKIKEYVPKIKICFLGTAPIKLSTKQEFEEMLGIILYENFALSETTFLTAETKDNIRFREQSSVGEVMPHIDMKIRKIDGIDDVGTICVKTPYLFEGYVDENGKTELELDADGYFDTKDLGYFNEDGLLVLSGRNRDIIKKGGNFVSLVEIEKLVGELPQVEECVAVPIEHDFYGESYILCIIPSDTSKEDNPDEQIRLWLLNNIVPYKMPETIRICREFPRTASGKVQKNRLRQETNG
ncbi:MAG: acyl--CoA ligase [Lachnospiraceae bacterium]|nr:acyl--CoA ligase [Lachnospiraceae bacterium]